MNTKRIAAAIVAAAAVVLGSASGAFASYGAPSINLVVNPPAVVGGQGSFTGTATSNEDCTSWSITFAGPSDDAPVTGSGSSISFTISTNAVTAITPATVTASCTFDDGASQSRATTVQEIHTSADVTVNPAAVTPPIITPPVITPPVITPPASGGAFLANTGGPHLWLAIGGALLTLIGAGAVIRSRRVAS
jgi:hypothetical protein